MNTLVTKTLKQFYFRHLQKKKNSFHSCVVRIQNFFNNLQRHSWNKKSQLPEQFNNRKKKKNSCFVQRTNLTFIIFLQRIELHSCLKSPDTWTYPLF